MAASMLPLALLLRSRHGRPSTSICQVDHPMYCRMAALCEITQNESDRVFRNVHLMTMTLFELAPFEARTYSAAA